MEKPLSAKVSWKAMATGFKWRENMPAPEFLKSAAAGAPERRGGPPGGTTLGGGAAGVEPSGLPAVPSAAGEDHLLRGVRLRLSLVPRHQANALTCPRTGRAERQEETCDRG